MTKTKQKRKTVSKFPPLASDDPIYTSGYIMLRPIRGRKPEPPDDSTVSEEGSDSTDTDRESSEPAV